MTTSYLKRRYFYNSYFSRDDRLPANLLDVDSSLFSLLLVYPSLDFVVHLVSTGWVNFLKHFAVNNHECSISNRWREKILTKQEKFSPPEYNSRGNSETIVRTNREFVLSETKPNFVARSHARIVLVGKYRNAFRKSNRWT